MSFDLPRDVILPVDKIDVRLDPAPHPFERQHLAEIDRNWLRERGVNPHVFDGKVALLSELSYRDARLAGRCHIVRYATFMYWRRNRTAENAGHAFAHAMLVSSDGSLVAIRMGPHTANPGRVYFAAGSFEPDDFIDGEVDATGNMHREVLEETGLDIAGARREDRYHLFSQDGSTMIFRRYWLGEDAATLARRVTDFVADEPEPEIEGPVVISSAESLPKGTMPHMAAIVRWHFSEAG